MSEGWLARLRAPGPRTGSCCCSCKSDISSSRKLGGHVPSNCLSAPRQLRYTVCRCPQTAPLHCLSATTETAPLHCLSATTETAPLHCLSATTETAPLHCTSASRQLLCTVCRCPQTAPLHCLLIGM